MKLKLIYYQYCNSSFIIYLDVIEDLAYPQLLIFQPNVVLRDGAPWFPDDFLMRKDSSTFPGEFDRAVRSDRLAPKVVPPYTICDIFV